MNNLIKLVVIFGMILVLLVSGCTSIQRQFDPCEKEFEECNHGCGEGLLSGLCKDDCAYKYRQCKAAK